MTALTAIVRQLLYMLVLLSALTTPVYADNWMRSEGETFFKATFGYDSAHQRWDQENNLVDLSCSSNNWTHSQSYEYGLSYYYTAFGSIDLMKRRCGYKTSTGIGDLSLGVRGRLNLYRNGRTWEAALVVPTGHRSYGEAPIGSGLYGLRLGVFGSYGNRHDPRDLVGSNLELGANLHIWEGSAPEQLSGYAKINVAPRGQSSHYFAAFEGDYALIDRSEPYVPTINQQDIYGYDRLNLRLGYAQMLSLDWRLSIEATSVLLGRNASKTHGVNLSFSRNFMD